MIALYARVSTDMQETGLTSQLAVLRRYASEKFAGEAVAEFIDEAYTGANLERPGIDRMREFVRSGRVRIVVTYDLDRLGRELSEQLLVIRELEKAGVDLDFIQGGRLEKNPQARLLLQVRGIIAEYERALIRGRTQRGRLEAARAGRIAGGRKTFGYDQKGGALTINTDQAPIVRRIFAMAKAGFSMRAIVQQLNAEGILPQRGHRWQKSSVARMLRNETYAGRANYNRRRRESGGRVSFRPQGEWIPLTVPAIVDQETFDHVQSQLARNSSMLSGNRRRLYLLTGLVRCACGFRICGCASHNQRFYRCTGRDPLQGKRCRGRWLNADVMENTIKASIKSILQGGLLQRKVAEHVPTIQAVDYAAEIARAEKEIRTHRAPKSARPVSWSPPSTLHSRRYSKRSSPGPRNSAWLPKPEREHLRGPAPPMPN